jgi:hypothetical protein
LTSPLGPYADYLDALGLARLYCPARHSVESVEDCRTSHGYWGTTITTEAFGSMLAVTDPDGRECQMHTPPAADG